MTTRKQNFVTFYSPGTLFSESTTKPIESWDPATAARMAGRIKERHGSIPYGFQFSTNIVAVPVADGEGGQLNVEPKEVARSGMYFLEAQLETFDDVVKRNDRKEVILRENMQCNGYPIVATSTRRYCATHPFTSKDFTVDVKGKIVERGDDPRHEAYRAEVLGRK